VKDLPPLYFVVAVVLAALPFFFLNQYNMVSFPLNLIGIVPVLLGVQLNRLADGEFKKRDTPHDFSAPTTLVDSGILRYTRNPMYLGLILMLIGIALLWGNPASLAGALVFFLVMEFRTIPFEEKLMTERFGDAYVQYKARVRRWI